VLNSEPTAAAIATPMLRHSDAVLAVDLWLDVPVRGDGTTHSVHDNDEFNQATRHGWLSDREAAGARAGLEELTDLVDRDALLAFLAAAHPFGQLTAPEAAAMPSVPLPRASTPPAGRAIGGAGAGGAGPS
jgi:hypothetical protein